MSTGIDGLDALQPLTTERVVIDSVAVSARRADEPPDTNALRTDRRIDVVRKPHEVNARNAAVENVTNEIPAQTAIDDTWRGQADYFGAIATEVLRETTGTDETTLGGAPVAWGLVAARLGRKRNRSAFHSAFWFDPKGPANKPDADGVPRMQTVLTQWKDGTRPHKTWANARTQFREAERRVDALIQERQ
jgi:hypothetical protein